ncbi:lytic transglycosylase domain-containing protein [Clostridium botulinum]|uniref:lytic transglycosylase domain-containing protein n=1 Tax=Clostridium botulinum TaxID=1491 RepID=UPI001A926D03|nr:lytic transglycosylase domain-containing protein [Clostridium botulinum]MBO0525725.1 lytic transglycosylase domain-containing protein [Clostridium botulinum]MBO0532342.1 lytic transglycosylase domain-containing protein [Clostridium botulinum]MBO0539236.1 lytic transglycosylase domain-containing protein [Clostridium botulinum]MBO0542473.1 lytic transglycosylase domain-containing protein [Clostridium botulinum]MBO0548888.1 lytic transglycosylase domain-containing protein [Clostridium botulinu
MKVNSSEMVLQQMLQMQLMGQIMKSSFGDSSSFQIVLDSLLKAMENKDISGSNNMLSLDSIENSGNKYYGAGQRLEDAKREINSIKSEVRTGNITIDSAVEKASRKYGIDKDLLMSVIKQESDFNPNCVSNAGAQGLMQLMPGTASELGVTNPFDIEQNIDGGAKYLKKMLDMHGNVKELALAAYNAGPGTLQWRGVKNISDINKLPSETRNYVKNIMKNYGV